jgi:hypothetical protein
LRQQKNEEHTLKRRIWWSSNVSSRTSSAPERPYIMLIFASFLHNYTSISTAIIFKTAYRYIFALQ